MKKDQNLESILLVVLSVSLLSIIAIPGAFGVGLTFGPELTLSDSPGDSTDPQIAVNGSKIYVIWTDIDSTSGDSDILFKRSTDGGVSFTATAINITSSLTGDIESINGIPEIAFSDTGGFVYVVWEYDNSTSTDNDIFFARSTDSGATFETPVNLSAGQTTGAPRDQTIAVNGTKVYIAWSDTSEDSAGDIYFRASTDGGATFVPAVDDPPRRIFNDGNNEQSREPKLAAFGDNVYIFWQDEVGTDKMYFRASTNNGTNWTPTIGNTPSDFGGDNSIKRQPTIAVSGDKVHVSWRQTGSSEILYRTVTDTSGVYTFSPDLGSAPTTLRTFGNSPSDMQIAASGNNVNLVWREFVAGDDTDVFFTNSTNRGTSFSDVADLSGNGIEATSPDMVMNGTTTFVVWSNVNSITDSDIVALASNSTSGAKFGGVPSKVTDDDQDAKNPDVGTDGTKMFVVWEDDTGDDEDPEIRFRVGTICIICVDFDKSTYKLGDTVTVRVTSPTSNTNAGTPQQIVATATSDSEAGNISVTLTEINDLLLS